LLLNSQLAIYYSSWRFEDTMQIERLSGSEDLDAVAALEAESFTNPWTREMLERELTQSDVARIYVLRLPGIRVAAFCACWVVADELHINTIAVSPAFRRQGLAKALLAHVLSSTSSEGIRRATLEVRRSNVAARRLYECLGFSLMAVRTRYYTQPEEDALILWREMVVSAFESASLPGEPQP
jgi:[ribosomal protein S18]-alanine N-acetyltransferase